MENIMELKSIYKSFEKGTRTTNVLKGINLGIKKGEFVSIMGPSGSGKSTLLYIMGGIDQPTKGEITVDEENICGMKDKVISRLRREKIGFVFQNYNLLQNLSVTDNILVPAILNGQKVSQMKEKLESIIKAVGLADKKDSKPNQLSGGQQQRVAIARALINDPEIILADEPTGNLDTGTSHEIIELLNKICKDKNMTIVQVTHEKSMTKFSDRVIVLKDGEILETM